MILLKGGDKANQNKAYSSRVKGEKNASTGEGGKLSQGNNMGSRPP